jgi:hypothetical protein
MSLVYTLVTGNNTGILYTVNLAHFWAVEGVLGAGSGRLEFFLTNAAIGSSVNRNPYKHTTILLRTIP